MNCRELITFLETEVPLETAEGWDNPGFLVGDKDKEIKKVLVVLDITNEVVDYAIDQKADFILAHHPIIFSKINKCTSDDFLQKKLLKLIRHDICAYGMHTCYDVCRMGDQVADRLNLKVIQGPVELSKSHNEKAFGKGIGIVARIEDEISVGEYAKKVKEAETPKSVFKNDEADLVVEKRLIALYKLQQIDSQIDKIRIIRGELPLEVQDLEDETEGLKTRIGKFNNEISSCENAIADKQQKIKECDALVAKYSDQQNNVRNNREYESLAKEIEFQELEKQLCEKKIREFKASIENYKVEIEKYTEQYEDKLKDLEVKKSELDEIIKETEEKEKVLMEKM